MFDTANSVPILNDIIQGAYRIRWLSSRLEWKAKVESDAPTSLNGGCVTKQVRRHMWGFPLPLYVSEKFSKRFLFRKYRLDSRCEAYELPISPQSRTSKVKVQTRQSNYLPTYMLAFPQSHESSHIELLQAMSQE